MPIGDAPKCKADIIDPIGMRQIAVWFDKALAWLLGLVNPDEPQAPRPTTLVIGQDRFYEHRRGVVWDCRRESEGIITPLDFTAKPKSHTGTPIGYVTSLQIIRVENRSRICATAQITRQIYLCLSASRRTCSALVTQTAPHTTPSTPTYSGSTLKLQPRLRLWVHTLP